MKAAEQILLLKKEIKELRKALRNIMEGNDLAAAKGLDCSTWPDSDFRRAAHKLLDNDPYKA